VGVYVDVKVASSATSLGRDAKCSIPVGSRFVMEVK
jgi:hypothetical protein